jgi:hypothetical protein
LCKCFQQRKRKRKRKVRPKPNFKAFSCASLHCTAVHTVANDDIPPSTLISALEALFGSSAPLLVDSIKKEGISIEGDGGGADDNDAKIPLKRLEEALRNIVGDNAASLLIQYLQNDGGGGDWKGRGGGSRRST